MYWLVHWFSCRFLADSAVLTALPQKTVCELQGLLLIVSCYQTKVSEITLWPCSHFAHCFLLTILISLIRFIPLCLSQDFCWAPVQHLSRGSCFLFIQCKSKGQWWEEVKWHSCNHWLGGEINQIVITTLISSTMQGQATLAPIIVKVCVTLTVHSWTPADISSSALNLFFMVLFSFLFYVVTSRSNNVFLHISVELTKGWCSWPFGFSHCCAHRENSSTAVLLKAYLIHFFNEMYRQHRVE